MRFPAKKKAGCPKAPHDFPPRKGGSLHPPSGCLVTPLPHLQSLYGRAEGHTLTSQPKFLGSIDYQISLAMVLCWRASARAPLLSDPILSYESPRPTFIIGAVLGTVTFLGGGGVRKNFNLTNLVALFFIRLTVF